MDIKFKIKRATEADVEMISAFISKESLVSSILARSPEEIRGCQFFMAMCGRQLIGTIGYKNWADDCVEIIGHLVKKDFRNNGVGYELAKICAKEVKKIGKKRVFALLINPKMFQSLGFTVVEKNTLFEKIKGDCQRCKKNGGDWNNPRCDETAMQLKQ